MYCVRFAALRDPLRQSQRKLSLLITSFAVPAPSVHGSARWPVAVIYHVQQGSRQGSHELRAGEPSRMDMTNKHDHHRRREHACQDHMHNLMDFSVGNEHERTSDYSLIDCRCHISMFSTPVVTWCSYLGPDKHRPSCLAHDSLGSSCGVLD